MSLRVEIEGQTATWWTCRSEVRLSPAMPPELQGEMKLETWSLFVGDINGALSEANVKRTRWLLLLATTRVYLTVLLVATACNAASALSVYSAGGGGASASDPTSSLSIATRVALMMFPFFVVVGLQLVAGHCGRAVSAHMAGSLQAACARATSENPGLHFVAHAERGVSGQHFSYYIEVTGEAAARADVAIKVGIDSRASDHQAAPPAAAVKAGTVGVDKPDTEEAPLAGVVC